MLSSTTPLLSRTFTSSPVIPIVTSTTQSGKQRVEKIGDGDEEKELPAYTRLIPAIFTIAIFLVGLVVIYVLYYQKLKETNKK